MDKKPQPDEIKGVRPWGGRLTSTDEEYLLRKPQRLGKELLRVLRISWEYNRGIFAFRKTTNCITVFGSARFPEDHEYYQLGREIGQQLALHDFTVMTGGGPGLMEAVNRGAKDKNGHSIGCNIEISLEEFPNPYLDQWITFRYFFVRKFMLTKYSSGFIFLPGGFGTLDELFEMLTLVQNKKMTPFPLVLVGIRYWQPLIDYMKQYLLGYKTIDPQDLEKFTLVDSPVEAVHCIQHALHLK